MSNEISGSKGLLAGIELTGKKIKKKINNNSKENGNLENEEFSIKRSYSLKPSTIKKLQKLKIFAYENINMTYNEIVDEAINLLYETKKKQE